jgi:hypothetical protein
MNRRNFIRNLLLTAAVGLPFGRKLNSNSKSLPKAQISHTSKTIPIVYGQNRVNTNLVWYGSFTPIKPVHFYHYNYYVTCD